MSLEKKMRLGKSVFESVVYYGYEVWLLKREEQRKLLTLEIDYLRKSARVSKLQIKSQMSALGSKCKQNNQF